MIVIKENEFRELAKYMKLHYGINLTHKKSLIEGRLTNIITEKGFKNFGEYLEHAFSDKTGAEITLLVSKLTTNHTFFLRESIHFEFLKEKVLPYLASSARDKDLRIWSAGCSSGEEPYTLAMIINDFFGKEKCFWDSKILATDISMRVLDAARQGMYNEECLSNMPKNWKMNYNDKTDNDKYRNKKKIKAEVIFRVFNLMNEVFPFRRKFHVIFCRNVMIYFDQKTKMELVRKFYECTEPGGYLFIGHSESISRDESGYNYIMPAVYRKG